MNKLVYLAAALFVLTVAMPASAQQKSCDKRPKIIGHLANQFFEAPVAIGLSNNGGVVEVLSSKKTRSWTMIITMPDGNSCVMAVGENWETVKALAYFGPGA